MTRVLVIDHRDSFVFNLVEELERAGASVAVVRSAASLGAVRRRIRAGVDGALFSPGPGRPAESGVMLPLLAAEPELPVLGVCLGLQVLAVADGGTVGPAPRPVHGSATLVRHGGHALFAGLPSPFAAGRYHSLAVTRVPPAYRVLARTAEATPLPMALLHRERPRLGLQFHPESVLTPDGPLLLRNALAWLRAPIPRTAEGVRP